MAIERFGWGVRSTSGVQSTPASDTTDAPALPEPTATDTPNPIVELTDSDVRDILGQNIRAHAAALWTLSPLDYRRVIDQYKKAIDPNTSPTELQSGANEMQQHDVWADRAMLVEAAKSKKLAEIVDLSGSDLLDYDVNSGWPDLSESGGAADDASDAGGAGG